MTQRRARPAIRDVIAERVFERAEGRKVRLQVGRPREGRHREWVCEFRVLGVGHSKVYSLFGSDSLDALQYALGIASAQVESYREKYGLTFLGGSALLMIKPDIEAMRREIEAAPEFPDVAEAIGDIWEKMTGELMRRGASGA